MNLRQHYSQNFFLPVEFCLCYSKCFRQSQFLICFWQTILFFLSSSYTLFLPSSFLPPFCLPTLLVLSTNAVSILIHLPRLGYKENVVDILRCFQVCCGEKGKEGYRREFLIVYKKLSLRSNITKTETQFPFCEEEQSQEPNNYSWIKPLRKFRMQE